MSKPVELVLGASVDNQPSIELIIGSWGGDQLLKCILKAIVVTRRLDSGQTQVQPLNDREGARTIAQLTPPGYPGKDRIKALFQVDQQLLANDC